MKEKDRIDKIVKALEPELKELSHKIHDNPEIGMEEFKACAWQVELIKKHGFEVEENFCGMPTAYRASYKGSKPGPKIALISEYDALPEIGHACGHNIICMIGVGAGLGLKEFADEYGGTIYIYGTPAEESHGGKLPMVAQGMFDDIDAALEVHPACTHTDAWSSSALDAMDIEFFGRASHAAMSPEGGINALDAMILLFNAVGLMRQQTKDDIRIHGVIQNGGNTPGIIPEYTKAQFWARANRMKDVKETLARIDAAAQGAATATGCTVKCTYLPGAYKDTISNQTLSKRAAGYVEEQGYKLKWYNGANAPGASDLGDVSYVCPSIQLICGIGGPSPDGTEFGLHTHFLEECAGTDKAMDIALDYVKAMIATGVDMLTEPEFVAAIKEEFSLADK